MPVLRLSSIGARGFAMSPAALIGVGSRAARRRKRPIPTIPSASSCRSAPAVLPTSPRGWSRKSFQRKTRPELRHREHAGRRRHRCGARRAPSAADGYTLAFFTNGTAISVALFNDLPFDPLKQFVPVSAHRLFRSGFRRAGEFGLHTLGDFLNAAHDKPGTLNLGSIIGRLDAEPDRAAVQIDVGADLVIVPFRTSPDELVALLRGDIQMEVEFYAALKPRLQSGQGPRAGHQRRQALAGTARYPDGGRSRRAEFRRDVVERALCAGRHAAADRRQAQCRLARRSRRSGNEKTRARSRHRRRASTPAEIDARMRSDIAKWTQGHRGAHIPKQ